MPRAASYHASALEKNSPTQTEPMPDPEQQRIDDGIPPLVAIGASAGGLEALRSLFEALPNDLGCAYVVLQHFSAEHKSLMAELLTRHTDMPVLRASENTVPQRDHVYLNDGSHNLLLEDSRLKWSERDPKNTLNLPIDLFFESMAQCHADRSMVVVLSGTGSDGTRGLRTLKEAGGRVIVQSIASASFDGMPRSALATGLADAEAAPEEIPKLIAQWVREPDVFSSGDSMVDEPRLQELLVRVGRHSGIDFQHYKRGSVLRRVARRVAATDCEGLADYLEHIEEHPSELQRLQRELLISVTKFFRDRQIFKHLKQELLPRLFERQLRRRSLRVWVPACATGEEAYSIAMLLMEIRDRDYPDFEVRVLASDVDAGALKIANTGQYPATIVNDVTPEQIKRFFRPDEDGFAVTGELRSTVLFAPQNLLADPPFTNVQLVSCRNLLIYLSQKLQMRALAACRFSLTSGGYLLLGTSEGVSALPERFRETAPGLHIFEATGPRSLDHDIAVRLTGRSSKTLERRAEEDAEQGMVAEAAEALRARFVPPAAVVNERLRLVHVFGDVSPWLKINPGQIDYSVNGAAVAPLATILSTGLLRLFREQRELAYSSVFRDAGGEERQITLRLLPLRSHMGNQSLALVSFEPGEEATSGGVVSAADTAEIADLERELRLSREGAQGLIEELETTNEELQSTNEELIASNEELQSTNEELHAVNEELQTVNAEFRNKIIDLEQLHNDLDNIQRSTEIGTLLLDEELAIRRYTEPATNFLNLLPHDLGRPLEHLAVGAGRDSILAEARAVLEQGKAIEKHLTSHPERNVLVRITPYLKHGTEPSGVVVSFIDVTATELANARVRRILDGMPHQTALVARDGTILMTNLAWDRFAAANGAAENAAIGVGSNYVEICRAAADEEVESEGQLTARHVAEGLAELWAGDRDTFVLEYACHSKTEQRWFLMNAARLDNSGELVISHINITDRKLAEIQMRDLALRDPLTGVLNRRGLSELLTAESERARRHGSRVCAVLVDCDDFKAVNETHGHSVGDALLVALVNRISVGLRTYDRIARVGGDEFLLVFPGMRTNECARTAERLRRSISKTPFELRGAQIDQRVTMVVTEVDAEDPSLDKILTSVNATLAISKASGKDRVMIVGSEAVVDPVDPNTLLALVRHSKGLDIVRQPILDLREGRVIGYEMLTRGPGSLQQPENLFRYAVEVDMKTDIDLACLAACARAAKHCSGRRHINMLPSTLLAGESSRVADILLDPELLQHEVCIEIAEQELMDAAQNLVAEIEPLRRAGIKFAIDDVGFGRTSLEHLVLLEPDIVKIDRRFIDGIGADASRRRRLSRLVDICKALGSEIVAEGVEHETDRATLLELGISRAQGFLLGRPEAFERA